MIKSVFQGLFTAERDDKWSMVMPVKKLIQDLSAWVYRATHGEFITATLATTLTHEDSGKTILMTAIDNTVIALPAAATTDLGTVFQFFYTGADGGAKISISPAAADAIHGTITLAASVVELNGTDNKDLILTKTSCTTGNSVNLMSDGVQGWYVLNSTGIWASE
jgi:hypothetical protein